MTSLGLLFIQVVLGFYLIFAYSFFTLPFLAYVFVETHTFQEKVLRTISFVLTPVILPVLALLWIGWGLMSVFGGVFVLMLFAGISWLAWLNAHFPFGKAFKAWFKAANWVLQKVQDFLELIGVKKLFFGVPLSNFQPIEPA